jgi:hypothetical protein
MHPNSGMHMAVSTIAAPRLLLKVGRLAARTEFLVFMSLRFLQQPLDAC